MSFSETRKHELYFKQSECLYLPLTNITGHVEILKDFSNYQNEQKQILPKTPPHPYRGCHFLADSVSFFNQFFKKGVKLIRNTYCIKYDCPLRCLKHHPSIAHHSRGYYTPTQKLACFVLYLKIINTFLKNNIFNLKVKRNSKMALTFL